jgi:predicted RNA-binding protein with RPS1 domain
LLQNFNNDDAINPYQSVQVGDEIEVKIVGVNECGFLELIKIQKSIENKKVS